MPAIIPSPVRIITQQGTAPSATTQNFAIFRGQTGTPNAAKTVKMGTLIIRAQTDKMGTDKMGTPIIRTKWGHPSLPAKRGHASLPGPNDSAVSIVGEGSRLPRTGRDPAVVNDDSTRIDGVRPRGPFEQYVLWEKRNSLVRCHPVSHAAVATRGSFTHTGRYIVTLDWTGSHIAAGTYGGIPAHLSSERHPRALG